MHVRQWLIVVVLVTLWSCSALPKNLSQLYIPVGSKKIGDSVQITVHNISFSTIRFYINEKSKLKQETHQYILNPKTEYSFKFLYDSAVDFGTSWVLGNPAIATKLPKLQLPFSTGKTYTVLQGFDGEFSHGQSPFSRYAIDFAMPQGDTICVSAAGIVVGVVKDYDKGGRSKKWQPFANFITLYHPDGNYYTQYVHLQKNGVLVDLGDKVQSGEPIGIVGKTGYTTTPHLHFNVLKPVETLEGLVSIPYNFDNYQGNELKINTNVSN